MEHVSSVRPTGKFPGKLENLKKWAHFPGWNFQRNFVLHLHVSRSLYQFQVHSRAPRPTGVYDQMEQLLSIGNSTFAPTEISGFFSEMESAFYFALSVRRNIKINRTLI